MLWELLSFSAGLQGSVRLNKVQKMLQMLEMVLQDSIGCCRLPFFAKVPSGSMRFYQVPKASTRFHQVPQGSKGFQRNSIGVQQGSTGIDGVPSRSMGFP